jgi:GNAT superfamily N-acetyltransferase
LRRLKVNIGPAEIYVMGVKRPWHRHGIGRALIEAVVELAIPQGVRFLTVKTLSPSNDDPNYARTRLFYEAVGFLPIEEFPTLWGPENPCIFMLRPLVRVES